MDFFNKTLLLLLLLLLFPQRKGEAPRRTTYIVDTGCSLSEKKRYGTNTHVISLIGFVLLTFSLKTFCTSFEL